MTSKGQQELLVERAVELKKAWILLCLMSGYLPQSKDLIIPRYSLWKKKDLRQHVSDLESDVYITLKQHVKNPRPKLDAQARG